MPSGSAPGRYADRIVRPVPSFLFGSLVSALLLAPAIQAQDVSPGELGARIGLSERAIERVKAGEIVSEPLEPSSDKDLSLAVVMRLDAPIGTLFDFVDADRVSEYQTVVIAEEQVDPAAPSLAALTLPPDLRERLARDPAGTFYMSEAEARRVAAAAAGGPDAAQDAYREALAERVRAYWEKGIEGIEPYAGKGRSPADDLTHANEASRKIVRGRTTRAELDAPPARSPGKATHKIYWSLQKGRDQAAPVLIHRILYREDDGELFVQRRFYSGYDYDALQTLVGVLPSSVGGSVVFYTNRTYTAQVAGFGGGAKRSIGRKLLEGEVVAEMERARKVIPGS